MVDITKSRYGDMPVLQRNEKPRLNGRMGAGALMLTVLAFSAPIAVVEGFIPFTIQFGGPGAAFGFGLATCILLLFSVGYVTMAKHVPKPGDFYAFISSGLGKVAGLGAAFLAVSSYMGVLGGSYVFLGVNAVSLIESLGGPVTSWWFWALVSWIAVSTLGFFHIELSARILSIAMLIEIAIVMIFNVAVLFSSQTEGLSVTPLTPSAFMAGDMAVTMLYAIMVFLGFEATALFRDEVRDPDRTIPRATYGAVIIVGLLYTLSCYALVTAYGSQAWEIAKQSPTSMFAHSIGRFVAPIFEQIVYCSVLLSVFAALLSIQNVLSRYVLNLSVDKALPSLFSRIHSRHSSPYAASTAIAVLVLLFLTPFAILQVDGGALYGITIGIGSIGIITLMSMVSAAVIAWFARMGIPAGESRFKTFVAPALATVSLATTVVFAIAHLDLVVGGSPDQYFWVFYIIVATFASGCLLAIFFRYARRDVYDSLGRADRVQEVVTA